MYKLIYTDKPLNSIKFFINWYKESFINLYRNSWLACEEELIENYKKLWFAFYVLIKEKIREVFIKENIFWISKTSRGLLFTTISVNNYRLFVYFTEDKTLKTRFIEDIKFYKR